jgi:dihydroneopterin aldolase|tara:strand:+ start:4503 stop:4901 length:399 start_codon:yes stop_codon:yes gene_type:complete
MNPVKNIFLQNFSDKKIFQTVFLESAIRHIDIGIHNFEVGHPQRIQFDIFVAVDSNRELVNDDIDNALNYEYLIEIIDSKIQGKRVSLLETLAYDILEDVLLPEKVVAATVIVSKLDILDSGKIGCSVSRLK